MNKKPEKACELTKEQAEKVTAGKNIWSVKTLMHCDKCGYELRWEGNYKNCKYYPCPQCSAPAFHGISLD